MKPFRVGLLTAGPFVTRPKDLVSYRVAKSFLPGKNGAMRHSTSRLRLLTRPASGTAPGPFRRHVRRRAWRLLHRWRPRLLCGTFSLAGPPK